MNKQGAHHPSHVHVWVSAWLIKSRHLLSAEIDKMCKWKKLCCKWQKAVTEVAVFIFLEFHVRQVVNWESTLLFNMGNLTGFTRNVFLEVFHKQGFIFYDFVSFSAPWILPIQMYSVECLLLLCNLFWMMQQQTLQSAAICHVMRVSFARLDPLSQICFTTKGRCE